MNTEDKANIVAMYGYDYGAVATYANQWDVPLEEAISRLYERIQVEHEKEHIDYDRM